MIDELTFMYGTAWKEDDTARLTRLALEQGFRAIDTANQRKHYHEAGVGEGLWGAIEAGVVRREDVFLQTKFTHRRGQDHRLPYDPDAAMPTQVRQSFERSLEHLRVAQLDSVVIHGPSARVGLPEADVAVWRTLEELKNEGRVRHIGISNVTSGQLATLVDIAESSVSFVQNRCFARAGWDAETRAICRSNGIVYQGFSLLTANVQEIDDSRMRTIAEAHNATLAQVVFRFAQQIGMLPLTGTTDARHMAEDLACDAFDLSDDELHIVESIAR